MLKLSTLPTRLVAPLIFLLMTVTTAQATETAKPKAYFEPRGFQRPILHVDSAQYELGWFDSTYAEAAPAFAANPKAAQHFSDYLSDFSKSQYAFWGTVGVLVGALVLDETHWNLPSREKFLLTRGVLYGGLASGFFYVIRSSNHLRNAIDTYNGIDTGAASPEPANNLSFAPMLFAGSSTRGAGAGLSIQLEF